MNKCGVLPYTSGSMEGVGDTTSKLGLPAGEEEREH